jgi:hypothetical protein
VNVNFSSPPAVKNILEIAFHAVRQKHDTPSSDLIALYHQHFTTAVSVAQDQPLTFKRFSLIDPNVTLTVRSSTSER